MTETTAQNPKTETEVAWFVGSHFDGEDQTERFLQEGIWENGHDEKYHDEVKSMQPGDKIAIKSTYTKSKGLSFGDQNRLVSTMKIKVTGVIKENPQDGKRVFVDWDEPFSTLKEWYFFTNMKNVWKVTRKNIDQHTWMRRNLIDFAFNQEEQMIEQFLDEPYWKYRYEDPNMFLWTTFYEEMANALLSYKDRRQELLEKMNTAFEKLDLRNPLLTQNAEGESVLLDDICPFTFYALFNKGYTDENRIKIISVLNEFLGLEETIPTQFEGIPVVSNMASRFFTSDPEPSDIDNLWEVFESAILLTKKDSEENRNQFIEYFNRVITQSSIKWNITFGLYWIRPWDYLPLDSRTKDALENKLKIEVPVHKKNKTITGEDYLRLIDFLNDKFEEEEFPSDSYPDLSFKAWQESIELTQYHSNLAEEKTPYGDEGSEEINSYSKEDFLAEVFISEASYNTITALLDRKKNLILQGAPGVGKTFAAKRLAYSQMGEKDESRIMMIQFHQSYAYEDFIMGYRPNENGFVLQEGPFYQFCKMAADDPEQSYYFIIDEINRGNLSKIFGELMMLIEGDKRGDELKLTYTNEPFSVPENVYLIGMMNTADRSLAIIDYALRRRFSFYELEPAFETESFANHLREQGAQEEMIEKINWRIGRLNEEISQDVNLGPGFRIGHSYFTDYNDSEDWYDEIIQYEIAPLIKEYWFDEEEKAEQKIQELLR
ncbi:AAA family ATPase [Salisediminibacterium halotolerans]|uniref:AAA family ATPase n=1 Tax=Salisediminibacterium halotolerans TaxID=517425 RepID=UPI000F24C8C6|nr:AAA family ATPase [Salisediminibacterium halotolerans]RLJ72279.1 5-methylcytosine-specific restriction protein B [Actinophytocola xinjiangensis]RPE85493.1 5-methylcytosine-specific restriction protein B [Salisediminibacterium halotolerans]TWG33448.1 5-methylcytosine-specific restriction protein B [Salisediminibacterium halotolerans]